MNRDKVMEQLKIDEGVVYEIYLDHLGYPTFGIGHLILDHDPEHGLMIGDGVSEERVKEAFYRDFEIALTECKMLYDCWDNFPDEVQEVLINMYCRRYKMQIQKNPPKGGFLIAMKR